MVHFFVNPSSNWKRVPEHVFQHLYKNAFASASYIREYMNNQRRDTMRPFRVVFLRGTARMTVNENGPVPEITVYHPNIMHPATFSPDMEALEFVNANETSIKNALIQVIARETGARVPDREPILNMTMEGVRQVQRDGGPPNDQ